MTETVYIGLIHISLLRVATSVYQATLPRHLAFQLFLEHTNKHTNKHEGDSLLHIHSKDAKVLGGWMRTKYKSHESQFLLAPVNKNWFLVTGANSICDFSPLFLSSLSISKTLASMEGACTNIDMCCLNGGILGTACHSASGFAERRALVGPHTSYSILHLE